MNNLQLLCDYTNHDIETSISILHKVLAEPKGVGLIRCSIVTSVTVSKLAMDALLDCLEVSQPGFAAGLPLLPSFALGAPLPLPELPLTTFRVSWNELEATVPY